tara:strand:+ start:196 stop:390 length:195 start_codon:yes stop_codon:yes gene_type:complete
MNRKNPPIYEYGFIKSKILKEINEENRILNPFLGSVLLTMYQKKGMHIIKTKYMNVLKFMLLLQ